MIFEKIREELDKECWLTTNDDGETTNLSEKVVSLKDAINIINQVEAEYNNGWIAYNTEKPKEDGYYLIFTSDREIDVREYDYGNGWGWDGFEHITHWQPLPQPPKGEYE